MVDRRTHVQLFALRQSPPPLLEIGGHDYELVKVFKHDFFAATTLYHAAAPDAPHEKLVVKFGRVQRFWGLPAAWMGRALLRRERRFHRRIDGVQGIQQWVEQISDTAYALQYVEGRTLDTFSAPVAGRVFDELRKTLDTLHERGIAYSDLNKRSNIVITPDGDPVLIDFQIVVMLLDRGGFLRRMLIKRLVPRLQRADLYHLYKHKRHFAVDEMTEEQMTLSHRRGRLIGLHRFIVTPVRRLRRCILRRLHRTGRLVSPTADLEDHYQPEKATWRK